jgi:hypothetical protein
VRLTRVRVRGNFPTPQIIKLGILGSVDIYKVSLSLRERARVRVLNLPHPILLPKWEKG